MRASGFSRGFRWWKGAWIRGEGNFYLHLGGEQIDVVVEEVKKIDGT